MWSQNSASACTVSSTDRNDIVPWPPFLGHGTIQKMREKKLKSRNYITIKHSRIARRKGLRYTWHFSQGCNCNYILFTELPWPGDSEGTFRSSSQAATCPPVYHTRRRLHTVPLIAERQAGKL